MKELIDKFYSGGCTPEEAKLVMDWLLKEEEEEWEGIPPAAHPYEKEMLTVIKARTFGKVRQLPWGKIAVAASILLLCSLSLMKREVVIPAGKTTNLASFSAPANKKINIKLTDGSKILLEPGALLRYDSVTYASDRTLYLEGKALFTVSASTENPFTVHANGASIIALGTSFMVSGEKVQLFSGKVLIRKAGTKDMYLRAGEEMVYHHKDEIVRLPERIKHKSINVSNDSIVFDNVPLREVFDVFRDRYHIVIQCDEQQFNAVYFSGKVLASDPIALILRTITRINNLTLTNKEGVYIIR
jgi:ferric-dicitrate binding protein FerR (iron transport regulator)